MRFPLFQILVFIIKHCLFKQTYILMVQTRKISNYSKQPILTSDCAKYPMQYIYEVRRETKNHLNIQDWNCRLLNIDRAFKVARASHELGLFQSIIILAVQVHTPFSYQNYFFEHFHRPLSSLSRDPNLNSCVQSTEYRMHCTDYWVNNIFPSFEGK